MITNQMGDYWKITQPLWPTGFLICGALPICCKDKMRQHM